jgi:hypothetical protein
MGSFASAIVNLQPAQMTALFSGGLFVNVGTQQSPSGLLRGQVLACSSHSLIRSRSSVTLLHMPPAGRIGSPNLIGVPPACSQVVFVGKQYNFVGTVATGGSAVPATSSNASATFLVTVNSDFSSAQVYGAVLGVYHHRHCFEVASLSAHCSSTGILWFVRLT